MVVVQVLFSRYLGGIERVFLDHAAMLAARGHRVHCVVSAGARVLPQLARAVEASQGRISCEELVDRGWPRLLSWLRLRAAIRRARPGVLVAHGVKATRRLALVRPRRLPLFAVTHNRSRRLSWATHLLALTEPLRRQFVADGFPAERTFLIPNALPLSLAALPAAEQRPPHSPVVVGVLARLIPKKGVDLFLHGLRRAIDAGLEVQALIGGQGPSRGELEALATELGLQSRLRFLGWVDDAASFYAAIDLLCVPSREEPFGMVVLEAYAHGVVVLAAATGGLCELVQDRVTGRLFAAGDAAALGEALLELARQPAAWPPLRAAAYRSLPAYHPDHIARRLEQALASAAVDAAASGLAAP